MERAVLGIVLAALAAPLVGEEAAPSWLRDAFVARSWEVGADEEAIALLDDDVVDLVATMDENGGVALQLRQPGTIVTAPDPAKAGWDPSAFAKFAALDAKEWLAFTFDVGADGRPRPTVATARAWVGGPALLLRTIRRCEDGGGALARVAARAGSVTGRVRLELDVLRLSPDSAPLPGAEVRARPPAFPSHGEALLFAEEPWGHPSWGNFDCVTLDRDHVSWRVGRAAPPRLLELRLSEPFDADVADRGFGFERALRVTSRAVGDAVGSAAPDDRAAPSLLAWRELKADALAKDDAVGRHALVLLESSGEAAIGAWAVARDPARKSELHPAHFSAQADDDGRVALPVERRAAGSAALEVVAFVAGPRARFGRRLGVAAPTGGECVVLLDERATTTVTLRPPPGRPSWIGFHVAGGAFLLPLAAEGVVKLPALGEEALLHLGAPYAESGHRLLLAPDAAVTIEASLRARS